jgi:CRISPR/Cas system-associated protein Csm6
MRDRIRARLREYRTKALLSIVAAVNKTKSKFSGAGRLNSHIGDMKAVSIKMDKNTFISLGGGFRPLSGGATLIARTPMAN